LLARAAEGRFPSALYIEGPDESLKAAFLAELRRAWAAAVPASPAARVMRPGENPVDEILSAHHGISLFAPRELTIVFDVEDFGHSEKRVAAMAEGAARPAGESCLVLVESAADAVRKSLEPLRAACSARWIAQPLDSRSLLEWGRRRIAGAGLTAEPGALEALLEVCEGEATAFFNELGKLEAWCATSGRATKTDVEALSRPAVGAGLDDYLLAVASGRAGLAAQRLGRLLAAGESEGGVLWALGNLVGGALGGWTRKRELAAALARRRKPPELARALDAVYRAEAAWKGGRVDVLAALEQATREVAAS
jgi:DNA polymerase III delta subunit